MPPLFYYVMNPLVAASEKRKASDVGDKELKRAYRKLMSENHPDKLIAQGVPEDMIKLATERSQEIQAAYEMIKKSRG